MAAALIIFITADDFEAIGFVKLQCRRILLIDIHCNRSQNFCIIDKLCPESVSPAAIVDKQHLYLVARQPHESRYRPSVKNTI